jgi:ribulose-5-phosphate 4-epimerase/fuculose-1-phosphate aldolase
MIVPDPILEEFAAASRKAAAYGLMRCSSGNMSRRLTSAQDAAPLALVKASRAWMAELTRQDISLVRIADGSLVHGRSPSVETGFHTGVLRVRSDVNVVLHFQTPCATALACRPAIPDAPHPYAVLPEVPYYIGEIAHVPYVRPGSPELAAQVVLALQNHDLAMLANHGQVVVGKSYDDAIQKAVFFELACEILLRNEGRSRLLTSEEIHHLKTV